MYGVIFAPIWPDKEIPPDSVLATIQHQSVNFDVACTLTRFLIDPWPCLVVILVLCCDEFSDIIKISECPVYYMLRRPVPANDE